MLIATRLPIAHDLQNRIDAFHAGLVTRPASGDFVFIAIDSESIDSVGQWPWPRSIYAKIIDKLVAFDTAEIAFDIDFSSKSTEDQDNELAAALERAGGSVILAAFRQNYSVDANNDKSKFNYPIEKLIDNAWAASVNVVADKDGIIRSFPAGIDFKDNILPSIPFMFASNSPLTTREFRVDYSIDLNSIPVYSVKDLLSGKVKKEDLQNKKVLVGAQAVELRDTFAVPVWGLMPGALLQIMSAETIKQHRILHKTNPPIDYTLAILILLAGFTTTRKASIPVKFIVYLGGFWAIEAIAFYLQTYHAVLLGSATLQITLAGWLIISIISELDLRRLLLAVTENKMRNIRATLQQIVADNFDGIVVATEDGLVEIANDRALKLFHRDNISEVKNAPVSSFLPEAICEQLILVLEQFRNQKFVPGTRYECAHVSSENDLLDLEFIITPSWVEDLDATSNARKIKRAIACITICDVTEIRRHARKIEFLASHDSLTGAGLRNELSSIIEHSFYKFDDQRNSANPSNLLTENPFALLGLDLRRFGWVNDTFGRAFGDQVLAKVVERISRHLDSGNYIARIAGDSFIILARAIKDDQELDQYAKEILEVLTRPMKVNGHVIQIECRFGGAGSWQGFEEAEAIIQAVETAMDEAQTSRHSGVVMFDPNKALSVVRSQIVEKQLQNALSRDEFECYFQPQIDLKTGRFIGAEALVRWNSEELGFVSPVEFIEIAERNGAIDQIGNFMLQQGCKHATRWPQNTIVSINVSPMQITSGNLLENVKSALKNAGLPPHRLCIEITETVFLEEDEACTRTLNELRKMGIKIALDDFGTGFSSFEYLVRLPIDKLKIDQAFVRTLQTNVKNKPIVNSMVSLAKGLGLATIVEGVESEEDARWLTKAGCEIGQGYHFSKPVDVNTLSQWLLKAA